VRGALLLLALGAASCACSPAPAPGPALAVIDFSRKGVSARVEVAATPEERERGLMFRDSLPENQGMLFAYPDDRPLGFWMKNCAIPLSAAFLDRRGRILNIVEMAPGAGVPDDDLPRYRSAGDARFVLEMESLWFARKGVGAGDIAAVGPALRGVVPR
jgi:uncharacterized membrane protein (UPF0127 family)